MEGQRRQPTDDIASMIANGEIDGVPIDESDFNLYFILRSTPAVTPRATWSPAASWLLEHAAELARLRADVDGILASGSRRCSAG